MVGQERQQGGGALAAREALLALLPAASRVTLGIPDSRPRDNYGRLLAIFTTSHTGDAGAELVAAG